MTEQQMKGQIIKELKAYLNTDAGRKLLKQSQILEQLLRIGEDDIYLLDIPHVTGEKYSYSLVLMHKLIDENEKLYGSIYKKELKCTTWMYYFSDYYKENTLIGEMVTFCNENYTNINGRAGCGYMGMFFDRMRKTGDIEDACKSHADWIAEKFEREERQSAFPVKVISKVVIKDSIEKVESNEVPLMSKGILVEIKDKKGDKKKLLLGIYGTLDEKISGIYSLYLRFSDYNKPKIFNADGTPCEWKKSFFGKYFV